MNCRPGCAACCIVPSISSPIPGMPDGKPAFTRCVQLGEEDQCLLFGLPERPLVCSSLAPRLDMCGADTPEAFMLLEALESATGPRK